MPARRRDGRRGPSTSSSRTPTRSSPTPSCPFDPAGWVVDVESQYPSDDRQQLLAFGSEGETAVVTIGSHAFAWRLPGVIAGALMALCLYLLARILFRAASSRPRRAFVLLDGMLFVQTRIAMNDVYVGLFIVAAYTVFAAVWTGWWRSLAAFWLAMPVDRRAARARARLEVGRRLRDRRARAPDAHPQRPRPVLAILGLIAITSVLGYVAISVPEGQGDRQPDVPR